MNLWDDLIIALRALTKKPYVSISAAFSWTGGKTVEFKYFHPETDPKIIGLDERLLVMLDSAREAAGVPFVVTSGKRTPDQNGVLKGAVSDSSHLSGLAVDLYVPDASAYFQMLRGLYKAGFRRFGHYFTVDQKDPNNFVPRHLHVDIDQSKPQDCAWCKKEQN